MKTVVGFAISLFISLACTGCGVPCGVDARHITGFSLAGQVRVDSCTQGTATHIVATLDSATTEQTVAEAKSKGYLPIETLGDTVVPHSIYEPLVGRHGWFYSTYGKNGNGGFVLVFLDVPKRMLSVDSYAN